MGQSCQIPVSVLCCGRRHQICQPPVLDILFISTAEMDRFPLVKMDFKSVPESIGNLGYSPRKVKMKNWNGRVERTGRKNCWKTHERGGGKRQLANLTICL